MNNKFLVGALVILMLLVSGLYFRDGAVMLGSTGTRFPNGISADSTSPIVGEVRGTTLTLTSNAAITGTITQTGATLTINGATVRYAGTSSLTAATTTVCALQSPSATSSLVYAGIKLTVSSSTASIVTIAKATTAFATTTNLGAASIAANAQGTVVATSTINTSLDPTLVFGPSNWVVFGMQGGTGTFSPTGTCSASWAQI